MSRWRSIWLLLAVLIDVGALPVTPAGADGQTVQIGWLSQAIKRTLPVSYLDQPPEDEGVQGARLGIADNNTTGHFTDGVALTSNSFLVQCPTKLVSLAPFRCLNLAASSTWSLPLT